MVVLPVVSSVIYRRLQESKLSEQFDGGVSPQTLGPQVGHLLGGIRAPMGLGHLQNTNVKLKALVNIVVGRFKKKKIRTVLADLYNYVQVDE